MSPLAAFALGVAVGLALAVAAAVAAAMIFFRLDAEVTREHWGRQ